MKEKLIKIQKDLKVPKDHQNTFGGYKYRNCEDILEAVKPLLEKEGLLLTLSDKVEHVGERYYIQATAVLVEPGTPDEMRSTAYAREADTKKGMDEAQVTGAASSYARKYALNGLFAIDDTKDPDTDEHQKQSFDAHASIPKAATDKQIIMIKSLLSQLQTPYESRNTVLGKVKTIKQATTLIEELRERLDQRGEHEAELQAVDQY